MSQPLIVIQARKNSSRLHNKINQLIGHKRMIDHVIDRCRKTGLKWSLAASWDYLAIAEEDVLGRFHEHLQGMDPQGDHYDPILRVTADCPLLAPWLITYALSLYREGAGRWGVTKDYLVATSPKWDGLDVEVISRGVLARAHALAVEPRDREHVTPWIRRHARWHEIPLEGPALRWSVDDQEGLDFVRNVIAACALCAQAVPHHTNAKESIGGADREPVWDLHQVEDGGLAECTAADLLMARRQEQPYVSL
jgi:spore coat polysaccharide biosynthesis protein SpsF